MVPGEVRIIFFLSLSVFTSGDNRARSAVRVLSCFLLIRDLLDDQWVSQRLC